MHRRVVAVVGIGVIVGVAGGCDTPKECTAGGDEAQTATASSSDGGPASSGGSASPGGGLPSDKFPAGASGEVLTVRAESCGRAIEASATAEEQNIGIVIHRDSVRIRTHLHAQSGTDLQTTDIFYLKPDGTATKAHLMILEDVPLIEVPLDDSETRGLLSVLREIHERKERPPGSIAGWLGAVIRVFERATAGRSQTQKAE
jgi:hypothetical protein